jgi:hypothetical protein
MTPEMSRDPIVVPDSVREVIDHLATIPRAPGSPGEAEAAAWFAERLATAGADVEVQAASFQDGYAKPVGLLCALSLAAALIGLRPQHRRLSAALATAAGLGIADDVSNTRRLFRSLFQPRATQNVVATLGDPDAERTLVVLGHHDAAPTGAIFDDAAQHWATQRLPGILERVDTGLPLWWLVLGGPIVTTLGALKAKRGLTLLGALMSAVDVAVFADIASSPTVPGANDNLTALAAELGLAERLAAEPIENLKVMLVSCGAEEVIQGGIYSFCERNLAGLDRLKTWVLNLDTVGSPELAMLEGEGPLIMEDYTHRPFRELVARVADRAGAPVRRGMRARNSTDAVIPSRMGFPTATLVSFDRAKALTHYHMMSDTAANVHWTTVAHAIFLCEQVARELAANPWLS